MGNTFTDADVASAAVTVSTPSNCGIIGTNQRTITFEWRPNGDLTDADVVVLSDPTTTYGVRRQDTLATAVSAGTAMTRASLGTYTYTFTEPVNGLSYDYFVKATDISVSASPFYFQGELDGTGEARTGMALTEARNTVWATTKTDSSSNSASDVDRAIKMALDEFVRQTRFLRKTDDSINLTANVATISTQCLTDFRPERLYKAGIRHPRNANGLAWSSSSIAYAKNEIVQNDSLFYVASSAHTSSSSNEPGTSTGTVWRRVQWDREYELEHRNYASVARFLNNQSGRMGIPEIDNALIAASDRPSILAFRTDTQGIVWPTPASNWAVRLTYYEPSPQWVIGTSEDVTLNVPDEYMRGILVWGASAILVYRDWAQIQQSGSWLRFKEFIRDVTGDAVIDGGATYVNPDYYM